MAGNDFSEGFSGMAEVIKGYVNAKVDLIKLGLLQKVTRAGVILLTYISVIISSFAVAIFLMFSFSFWYGDQTGNFAQGFLISSAFFLFILFLIYLGRRVIFSRNLIKHFSRILFTDDENDLS
ncbi:MAG: hypothetical protein ACNA7V_07420 [Bacteroidales bacterium]